eukprot:CAMPEP_0184335722 /NCGR_PEP_ID=MMETSP1089-20130417/4246_1 /TAXON_ID=38269 ORGANISM="Gloeochaete wittrockiana, Strain SAG46.84" /NCGR_SAMPLE_ID=MMETSP1089 /ASSEMBLY_ACC=CAM_ASM_000445 /LENGTH=516 /DNA_ID=CAMNT_0026660535 /DNA_START=232 /DNA_END=1782 /DNA_ORIENTATION=+
MSVQFLACPSANTYQVVPRTSARSSPGVPSPSVSEHLNGSSSTSSSSSATSGSGSNSEDHYSGPSSSPSEQRDGRPDVLHFRPVRLWGPSPPNTSTVPVNRSESPEKSFAKRVLGDFLGDEIREPPFQPVAGQRKVRARSRSNRVRSECPSSVPKKGGRKEGGTSSAPTSPCEETPTLRENSNSKTPPLLVSCVDGVTAPFMAHRVESYIGDCAKVAEAATGLVSTFTTSSASRDMASVGSSSAFVRVGQHLPAKRQRSLAEIEASEREASQPSQLQSSKRRAQIAMANSGLDISSRSVPMLQSDLAAVDAEVPRVVTSRAQAPAVTKVECMPAFHRLVISQPISMPMAMPVLLTNGENLPPIPTRHPHTTPQRAIPIPSPSPPGMPPRRSPTPSPPRPDMTAACTLVGLSDPRIAPAYTVPEVGAPSVSRPRVRSGSNLVFGTVREEMQWGSPNGRVNRPRPSSAPTCMLTYGVATPQNQRVGSLEVPVQPVFLSALPSPVLYPWRTSIDEARAY